MPKQDIIAGVILFIMFMVMVTVVLPIGLDKEFKRQEVVAEYNRTHYGAK